MSTTEVGYQQASLATPTSESKISVDSEETSPTPLNYWEPSILGWKSTAPLCTILVLGGVALEVVLYRSEREQGFAWKYFSANEAKQFLKSFLAITLFIPVLAWLGSTYVEMKVLQPYLDLGRGDASSRNAITTEYLTVSPFKAVRKSYRRRHLLLTIASLFMLVTLAFQPLAGSLFAVRLTSVTYDVQVKTAGDLALSPTRAGSSTPFVAAAGFVDASMYNGAGLPSFLFIDNTGLGYTTPAFKPSNDNDSYSDGGANLTISTNLLAFQVECSAATSLNITLGEDASTNGNWTVDASLSPSCSSSFTVPNDVNVWQGLAVQAPLECITSINSTATYDANLEAEKYPVSFGFFVNQTSASVAFCYAYQQEKKGNAVYDITNGWLADIKDLVSVPSSSLEDYCYNGLQPYSDAYALGEGEAIGLALADAVINDALYNNGEAAGDFDRQNQILSTPDSTLSFFVQEAYRNYVMVAANVIFVSGISANMTGTLVVEENRLFALPVSVHLLAILCIVTGLSLSVIYYLHAQQRRNLHLADRPSTLGVAGALFARGRVAELLDPRDTNKDIERKLAGMKFKLDSETGAVERVDGDMV